MKHAFATFVFIAGSIAAFAGSAYALPLPVNPFAEANKSEVRETSWFVGNVEAVRGEVSVATIRWNGYTDNSGFDEVALRKKKH